MATDPYVNPKVVASDYAISGPILLRAEEIEEEMNKMTPEEARRKYPFPKVVHCNEGNPQRLGQKPVTFFRQVMALFDAPFLMDDPVIVAEFPPDAVARAREVIAEIGNTTGAYTESLGWKFARRDVATFIAERDRKNSGRPDLPAPDLEAICLTDGSSQAAFYVLQLLLSGPKSACMIPIPQYPLYAAALTIYDATIAPYYLDEPDNWILTMEELNRSYNDAVKNGTTPRVIVIVNPGNPTGSILPRDDIECIVKFAHDHKLVLMVDEVYQTNVYSPEKSPFHSFREVVLTMPAPYCSETVVASLHTVSKGLIAECGRRGGYVEFTNAPQPLLDQLKKIASINLCANVNGQLMVSLMCRPPKPGDPSYELYNKEEMEIFESLKRKTELLSHAMHSIKGFTCSIANSAMYAFPFISIPKGFVKYNAERNEKENTNMTPDARWCLEFLERSGFFIVPGSGFGQREGTYHFRTTVLAPEEDMKRFVAEVEKFHHDILLKYEN